MALLQCLENWNTSRVFSSELCPKLWRPMKTLAFYGSLLFPTCFILQPQHISTMLVHSTIPPAASLDAKGELFLQELESLCAKVLGRGMVC